MEDQLVFRQGTPQLAFQMQAPVGRRIHRFDEELVVVAAVGLGVIHRRVGVADQRLGILAVLRVEADTDRRRAVQHVPVDVAGFADGPDQAVDELDDSPFASQAIDDDDEFVAAQAEQVFVAVHQGAHPARQFGQQTVAGLMAERVVDRLEMVQIDDQQALAVDTGDRAFEQAGEVRIERQPVGQVGQRVVMSQVVEAVGLRFFVADVGKGGDKMRDLHAILANGRDAHLPRVERAVLAAVPDFAFPIAAFGDEVPDRPMKGQAMMAGTEHGRRFADDVAAGITGDIFEGGINRQDALRAVGDHHRLRGVIDDQALQGKPGIGLAADAEQMAIGMDDQPAQQQAKGQQQPLARRHSGKIRFARPERDSRHRGAAGEPQVETDQAPDQNHGPDGEQREFSAGDDRAMNQDLPTGK